MAAKAKDKIVAMVCSACKNQNYITKRNKVNIEGKLTLGKFCNRCRKKTEHRETQKLK